MCLRQQLSRDSVNLSEGTRASGCLLMDTFLQLAISESKTSGKATSRIELAVFGVCTWDLGKPAVVFPHAHSEIDPTSSLCHQIGTYRYFRANEVVQIGEAHYGKFESI